MGITVSVPHRMLLGVKKKKSVMRFSKKETSLAGRRAGGRRFDSQERILILVLCSILDGSIYLFSNYAGSIPLRCILKHSVVFDPRWNRRQRLPLYRIKC